MYPEGTGPNLDAEPALPHAFQPIPIHTIPKDDDYLLRSHDLCDKYKQLVDQVHLTPEWIAKDNENEPFLKRLGQYFSADIKLSNLDRTTGLLDTSHPSVHPQLIAHSLPCCLCRARGSTHSDYNDMLVCEKAHDIVDPRGVPREMMDESEQLYNWVVWWWRWHSCCHVVDPAILYLMERCKPCRIRDTFKVERLASMPEATCFGAYVPVGSATPSCGICELFVHGRSHLLACSR